MFNSNQIIGEKMMIKNQLYQKCLVHQILIKWINILISQRKTKRKKKVKK